MECYYQILPELVYKDWESIEELLRIKIPNFSSDYLRQVISVVACNSRKVEDPSLRIVYLRRLVPYAERYLIGLDKIGVIKRSPYYIPGEISYRYNITPKYQSRYIHVPLYNAKLIRRIHKAYYLTEKEALKNLQGCAYQVKYLRQLTFAKGWREFVETYKDNPNQYNSILASAVRIVNKDFFFSRDETERRFHSNITNMKKKLRKYLRINGKPLTTLDIKNSQPFLSTIILSNPSKVAGLAKTTTLSMLLETLQVSKNDDVNKYIKLVVDGQFYEYLMIEFAREGIVLDRKNTKLQVFRILFSPNRLPKNEINRKCRLIFKNSFPTVHRIFSKVRGRDSGTRFDNSNRFAILLATIESYLVIDVILKRVHKELPRTIALTIHDSIMTGILTDDVEAVRKIMNEELTYFIGYTPRIEIERNYKEEKIKTNEYIENNKKNEQDYFHSISLIQYDVTTSISTG